MLIVDTHTHEISDDHEKDPLQVAYYPGVEWVYEVPVTAEELLAEMAASNVDWAVLVQEILNSEVQESSGIRGRA